MSDPVTAARARAIARVGSGLPNASVGWLAEVGADEALKLIYTTDELAELKKNQERKGLA